MKTILIVLICLTCMPGCKKEDNAPAGPTSTFDRASISGRWRLTHYHDIATNTKISEPPEISRSIVLDFIDKGDSGTFSGHTITNKVLGTYVLGVNQKITVLKFGGTKAGESHNWGHDFWTAIRASNSYKASNSRLFIYYDNSARMLEFVSD